MAAMPPFHQPGPEGAGHHPAPNMIQAPYGGGARYTAGATETAPARRRGAWFWTLVIGGAILVLLLSNCAGFVVGIAASGSAPAALGQAQEDLEATTIELAEAQTAEQDARALVATCEEQADALRDELDEATALVAAGEVDLDTANERVAELEASIATLEARIVELETAAAAADARPAPAAAPAPAPAPARPAPSAGSNVYYENCTAARNAGAAPVRLGDPGYGTHLDRDRDGVGCE